MRFVTFVPADAPSDAPRPGALVDGGAAVVDLTGITPSVAALLADDALLSAAADAVADREHHPRDAVRLLPPVSPGAVLCLGYNYRGHTSADPTAPELDDPEHPDVFVKTRNVLRGADESVELPIGPTEIDYEGEIAIVIGRRAKHVSREDAHRYIGGLTLFNDVSARDWQNRTSQWTLGKSVDGFGPLGPAVVTLDEVGSLDDLLVEVVRDGEVTVSQSTATMVFPIEEIVHRLSQVMTLEPGDVIASGTPQKLPSAFTTHRALADGDAVTIRVGRIGELTTVFTAPTTGVTA